MGQQVEDDKDKDPVRLVGQQASDFLCPLGHHAEHDDVKALPGGLKVGDLLCPVGQEVRDFSRPVGHQAEFDDVKVEPGGVRMLKWGLYPSFVGAWTYSFIVELSADVDTGNAEFITDLVDCEAYGSLAGEIGDMDLDTRRDSGKLSGSVTSSSPLNDCVDTSFVFYFREAVQAGEAAVTFTKTVPVGALLATSGGGMTTTSTFESIATSTASCAKLTYDTKYLGSFLITFSAFDPGAKCTVSLGAAAFMDIAGDFNPVSTLSVTYNVYVTTSIGSYFPTNGDSTNVTEQTNIMLEFAAPVSGGIGNGFYLCKGWTPYNLCFPSTAVT